MKHTTPWTAGDAQRVGQGWGADEFECSVDAVGHDRACRLGDVAVVDQDVVDADVAEGVGAVGVASGGQHGHAESFGEHGGGHPDRRRAATDQDRLAGSGVESDRERAVGGLEHLGHRPERGPVEARW